MINYGMLTDKDLLKLMVLEKDNESISDELFSRFTTLADILVDSDEAELIQVKGIGRKRVQQIKAINELTRRLYNTRSSNSSRITSPNDVAIIMMPDMKFLKKEHLTVLLLNTKNVVISIETVSIGTLNASLIHPREVFNTAIRKSAASIILCHNHPSGDTTPSSEDLNITNRIKECGRLLGIDLLDHVIIGDAKYLSLKDEGVI